MLASTSAFIANGTGKVLRIDAKFILVVWSGLRGILTSLSLLRFMKQKYLFSPP